MKALHNIEKSEFHVGNYVGYGRGHVWQIRRLGRNLWRAHTQGSPHIGVQAPTLARVAEMISSEVTA